MISRSTRALDSDGGQCVKLVKTEPKHMNQCSDFDEVLVTIEQVVSKGYVLSHMAACKTSHAKLERLLVTMLAAMVDSSHHPKDTVRRAEELAELLILSVRASSQSAGSNQLREEVEGIRNSPTRP